MTNKPRNKGTAAETAVVQYLRNNGFPHAERRALHGNQDKGDILAAPGLILEIKAHATAATGQPGPSLLTDWMAQAETERTNANADLCPLVVKRKGTTNPGNWFTYLPLDALHDLTTAGTQHAFNTRSSLRDAPVCLTLHDLTNLLHHAGYGTPNGPDQGADPTQGQP